MHRFRYFLFKCFFSVFTNYEFLVSCSNGTTIRINRSETKLVVSLFDSFFFLNFFSLFFFSFGFTFVYRRTHSGVPWKGFVARMQSQDPQIGHMSVTQQKVPASSSKFQDLFYMDWFGFTLIICDVDV